MMKIIGVKTLTYQRLLNLILAIYIVLKPFYLWRSGMPQIAELFLVLFIIIALFRINISSTNGIPHHMFSLYSILFMGYVVFVNCIWFILVGYEISLIINSLFYIFNIVAMLTVLYVFYDNPSGLLNVIYKSIVFSVLFQTVLYFMVGGTSVRETIFFNNPNQLAYYSLICLGFLFIVERHIKVKTVPFVLAIIGSVFLILTTASQAAIASFIFMYICYVITTKGKTWVRAINWSLIFTGGIFLYLISAGSAWFYNKIDIIDTIIWRFQKANVSGEGFLIERAYDRILNHPEYWILGAGEGAYDRFNSVASYEIHSTLGNIFFSYGIIGLILFMAILVFAFRKTKWIYSYPIIGLLIYGLTHNGIRNSLFWIMLTLLIVVSNIKKTNKEISQLEHTV